MARTPAVVHETSKMSEWQWNDPEVTQRSSWLQTLAIRFTKLYQYCRMESSTERVYLTNGSSMEVSNEVKRVFDALCTPSNSRWLSLIAANCWMSGPSLMPHLALLSISLCSWTSTAANESSEWNTTKWLTPHVQSQWRQPWIMRAAGVYGRKSQVKRNWKVIKEHRCQELVFWQWITLQRKLSNSPVCKMWNSSTQSGLERPFEMEFEIIACKVWCLYILFKQSSWLMYTDTHE